MQPKQIGPYHIRRTIASGGMGTVYEGIQQNPRRTVAVKMITEAVSSQEATERLKYEAQLLGRLQHPGIAEIYEAGTHEQDGKSVPYFAMEYIANARSITAYAAEKKLGIRERLKLFLEVCDAVHHGHLRGIVHRDLKPANILVDSGGRVRVIDFGIARATDADLRRTTSLTEVGQLVGSAAYMSPEQFAADPRDIDTRSDVYALGVVLYELLTGALPYDVKSKTIFELASTIRDERPPLLSTHDRSLRGDLETIVDKALQKERDHRYESAHAFAEDIRRYLSGEAITARTPSLAYHVRVLARRHKLAVGSMATIFVLLIAGVLIVSQLYVKVDAESERAHRAQEFLKSALSAASPRGWGSQTSVVDMYDKVTHQLDSAFAGEPALEAEVRQLLALAYFTMFRYDQAEDHLLKVISLRKEALGESHEKTLEAMGHLSFLYSASGQAAKRAAVRHDIWKFYERTRGEDDEQTLSARSEWINNLPLSELPRALELSGELVELWKRKSGDDARATLDAEMDYAHLLLLSGQVTESLNLARDAYERIRQSHESDSGLVEHGRRKLAAGLLAAGETDAAKALYGHRSLPPRIEVVSVFQGNYEPQASGTQVIMFWETWCPFCLVALPILEQVQRDYSGLGLQVIGMSHADGDSVEMHRVLQDRSVDYTVVQVNDYGGISQGIPYTWVLHDGELVWEGNPLDTRGMWKRMMPGLAASRDAGVELGS